LRFHGLFDQVEALRLLVAAFSGVIEVAVEIFSPNTYPQR
jgi:hypothetical protein